MGAGAERGAESQLDEVYRALQQDVILVSTHTRFLTNIVKCAYAIAFDCFTGILLKIINLLFRQITIFF